MEEIQHPAEQGSTAQDFIGQKNESQGSPSPQSDMSNGDTNKGFLPSSYEVPASPSNYMKFEAGENRFRILASPVIGHEWWTEDKDGNRKPVRVRMDDEHPNDAKHFWAMPVWNYKHERVQILEVTQKGIQQSLNTFASGSEWGSPIHYDVSVIRQGDGRDTMYQVIPNPHAEVNPAIKATYAQTSINLDSLFEGDDPFAENGKR